MKWLFILLFFPYAAFGQVNLDSLWGVWENKTQPDTNRCKAIFNISWHGYLFTQPDSAFYFAQLQYDFAEGKGLKKHMAIALVTQGFSYFIQGDYANAMDYHTKSMQLYEEIGDKKGKAGSLGNIGLIYINRGDYAHAIDYITKSLKLKEEIGDKKGTATSLGNIAIIHANQGDYANAIDYYSRGLKIAEENGDKKIIATFLINIGSSYNGQKGYTRAMDYYTKGLKIQKEIGDKPGIASTLVNIGLIYADQGDYANAMDYYTKSLHLYEEISDKHGMAISLNNIGIIYHDQKNYVTALDYGTNALSIAQEIGFAKQTKSSAKVLYGVYKATGKHKLALEMYELFVATRDSLESEENQKEVIRQQFKYDYEKEALADSLEFAKEQEVKDLEISEQQAQLKQEATVRYALMGGGGLFLILALVAFRSFRLKRKDNILIAQQKEEVEHQKDLVDEKNQEITDSITYAQRIQEAILPPDRIVKEYLKESFIYYKPKDIVAGDFYWMEAVGDTTLFAAADCTGHGVPGAMVSVVCHNALNRAVREFKLTEPGKILDKVRELVIETFEKSDHEVKDGMDIALCSLQGNTLHYAGANNPLWVYRKGMSDIETLEETKPNKQPIGKYAEALPFTTHTVQLNVGDSFYLFTDGFPDQFGGPKGKKFKYKPFKQLLLDGLNNSMEEQLTTISQSFEQWRGELEQVDDVCVIGVRV